MLRSSRLLSLKRVILITTAIMAVFMVIMTVVFFYLFFSAAEEQVQDTFESLADNVETRIMESISSIDSSAKRFAYSGDVQSITFFSDPEEYFRSASPTEDIKDIIMNSNPNISAIFIQEKNGRNFYTDLSKKQLFNRALEKYYPDGNYNIRSPFFSTLLYSEGAASTPYVFYFYPFYNIRTGEFERDNSAVCAVLCNVDHLVSWLAIDNSRQSAMAILYKNNIISSSRPLTKMESTALGRLKEGRGTIYIGGRKYLSNSVTLQQFEWQFVYVIPENELLGGMLHVRNISFIILLCAILLLCLIMMRIITLITKPVQQILVDMRAVRKGERDRVQVPAMLELQELASGINRTLDSIEDAYRKEHDAQIKLYRAVMEQNHAQLYAYRNQINPHFLFNTLECMRSMARHFGVKPLEKLISSLSSMFRYSLRSKIIVTLREEINHLENYMGIMEQRASGGCKLRTLISKEAMQCAIPAMSLQPIVENSVSHGFRDKKSPHIIFIRGRLVTRAGVNFLQIRIVDNGCGISEDKLARLREGLLEEDSIEKTTSIGLNNIAKRLRLIFGEESEFLIKSSFGHYTAVELNIPQKQEDFRFPCDETENPDAAQ
jgi:two-component system sensor histidine kinase YesM